MNGPSVPFTHDSFLVPSGVRKAAAQRVRGLPVSSFRRVFRSTSTLNQHEARIDTTWTGGNKPPALRHQGEV